MSAGIGAVRPKEGGHTASGRGSPLPTRAGDEGLPRAYTKELFSAKAGAVFQHVYERYGMAA